tara:strand:- start:1543 stop:1659 length:117 start_codon:yes stop_codon:yes gene_type:complete
MDVIIVEIENMIRQLFDGISTSVWILVAIYIDLALSVC